MLIGKILLLASALTLLLGVAFSESMVEIKTTNQINSDEVNSTNGWYNTKVNVSFSWNNTPNGQASKDSWIFYCTDQENTCEPKTKYDYQPINFSEGINYIRYIAYKDGTNDTVMSHAIKIDKTPPIVTGFFAVTGIKGLTADVSTKTYTANHGAISFIHNAYDNQSGLNYCEYNIDYLPKNPSLNWQPAVKQRPMLDWNKAIYYYSTIGEKNIAIRCTDNAGNVSDVEFSPFKVNVIALYDSTAPLTTIEYSPDEPNEKDWLNKKTTVKLNPIDLESGVKKTLYCQDTTNTCTPSIEYDNNPLTFEQGKRFLRFYSINNHEVEETIKSVEIKIDETAPNIIGFFWINGKVNENNVQEFPTGKVKLRVNSAEDELSKVFECLINFDYENNKESQVINPNHTNWVQVPLPKPGSFSDIFEYDYQLAGEKKISFKCIDNAGNESILPPQEINVLNVFHIDYFDITPNPARLDKNFTIDLNLSSQVTKHIVIKLINGNLTKEYIPLKKSDSAYTLTIIPDETFSASALIITAIITDIEGNTRYYTINKNLFDGYLVELRSDSTQKTIGSQLVFTGKIISKTGRNLPTDRNIEIRTDFGSASTRPDANGNFSATLNLTQIGTYDLNVYFGRVLTDLNNSISINVTPPAATTMPVSAVGSWRPINPSNAVDQNNANKLDQNAPTDINLPIDIDANKNSPDQNIPLKTSDENALEPIDLGTTDTNSIKPSVAQPTGLFGLFDSQNSRFWVLPVLIIALLILVWLGWIRNQQLISKK